MLKRLILLLLLGSLSTLQAQEKLITGIVKDVSGPLPGVRVLVKGTTTGTETGFDGEYEIKAQKGDVLVFYFIGMKTVFKTVKDATEINVIMKEDEEAVLEEVVVTASGIKRKVKGMGYAVTTIKSESVSHTRRRKPQSGQLTAGEINDIEKWEDWLQLHNNKEFLAVKDSWKFDAKSKVEVFVKDRKGQPIINASVTLSTNEGVLQSVKTDVFGKAILYRNSTEKTHVVQAVYKKSIQGFTINKNHKLLDFRFAENEQLHDIDVMFTIDATGSMGDEINYLKSEIENIITRIDTSIQKKRVGLTFYRDERDDYVVRDFDFTTNIADVKENLSRQYAAGGGDYEEAVEQALRVSLAKQWNENAKSKLLFLLLDAPPHLNPENIVAIKTEIKKAQAKGIKIIPIVASGADKTVEFLMRYFSVSTNGTYVFLTDDSGIGNPHLKPTTEDYKVERLNDLIVRLIEKYAGVS